MIKTFSAFALLLASTLAFSSPQAKPVPLPSRLNNLSGLDSDVAKALRAIATRYKVQYNIPGLLAGVWVPGQGQLIIEEGVADLTTSRPITRADHVRIASITKSFTTTVILQYAQEGLLSLQKSQAKNYLPWVQNGNANIAQLANMRSGIFNYTEDGNFINDFLSNPLKVYTQDELVQFANTNVPYFPPNANWHYSNTNTVILGIVAEQITGQFIGNEITQRIIKPLGLKETSYPLTAALPEPFSRGYVSPDLIDFTSVDPSSSAASGAMISTLDDLKCWGEALGTGALLSKPMQDERIASLRPIQFSPCADDDPARLPSICPEYDEYGYGIGELSGWIGHTGDFVGYQLLVMYEPNNGSVVVIIINLSGVGGHIPTSIFREYAVVLEAAFGAATTK